MKRLIQYCMAAVFTVCTVGSMQAQDISITSLGAKGDGVTLNTKAIQQAVDKVTAQGGGRVLVPAGTFLSGTIVLKDDVDLHLQRGATLLASTEHKDFPRAKQPTYRSNKDIGGWYALLYADGAKNIAVTGAGTIDGQGAKQLPRPYEAGGDKDGRTRNIMFISCQGVTVDGITLLSSGVWNQHYLNCEDVRIINETVYNHSNRNNDGLDIDGCRRVVISGCIIDSHDDAICLKSTGFAPTEDVVISNCIVSSFANGIKLGTESSGGFRDITVTNCIVRPSREKHIPKGNMYREGITGVSLETVDGGCLENISVSNIIIQQTMCPVYIRLGGRGRKVLESQGEVQPGYARHISVSNITSYDSGNWACSVTGIPGYRIEDVQLTDFNIHQKGGVQVGDFIPTVQEVDEQIKGYPQPTCWKNLPAAGLFLRHLDGVVVKNFQLHTQEQDVRPMYVYDDVDGLVIDGLVRNGKAVK